MKSKLIFGAHYLKDQFFFNVIKNNCGKGFCLHEQIVKTAIENICGKNICLHIALYNNANFKIFLVHLNIRSFFLKLYLPEWNKHI